MNDLSTRLDEKGELVKDGEEGKHISSNASTQVS
jgi:hypothetical protein